MCLEASFVAVCVGKTPVFAGVVTVVQRKSKVGMLCDVGRCM